MLPSDHRTDALRLTAAIGFLAEVREATDCTLTSLDREDLRRRASSGDVDAYAELLRRGRPERELVAA